jgi:hypothetical protein
MEVKAWFDTLESIQRTGGPTAQNGGLLVILAIAKAVSIRVD